MSLDHTVVADDLNPDTIIDVTVTIVVPQTAVRGIDDITNARRADGITIEGIAARLCEQHIHDTLDWITVSEGHATFTRGDRPNNISSGDDTVTLRLSARCTAHELAGSLDTNNADRGQISPLVAATMFRQHNPARGYIHWAHTTPARSLT